MTRRDWCRALAGVLGVSLPAALAAQEDPGKTVVGRVSVKVFYATNGDAAVAGEKVPVLEDAMEQRLRREVKLRFKHYRALGEDIQPLFRSYENWAQPLRPSDEVLVRFDAQSRPTAKSTRLDLELWLGRKKVLKTDVLLEGDRPLLVLGPEWRGGRLIIAVSLAAAKVVR
jgi:hypothetical protein